MAESTGGILTASSGANSEADSRASSDRRAARWLLAAAVVAWALVALPLGSGSRTLFFRDVFSNHLPLKAFGAQELRAGRVPALNPTWGLGQPFRGNPSTLAFYPGNLLYLALPFFPAFNLHFALHWLLALLTMRALARSLGQGAAAAALAGVTYAGSGWMLSNLSFYNLVAVAAWWPLALRGAALGTRRAVALGGVAAGLALLGGEPVTVALGLVPLACVALARHGPRRGAIVAATILGLGLVVALPQVVATARVYDFTFRGAHGLIESQAQTYSLHPARLLELVLPLPFGSPLDLGGRGFWAQGLSPRLPFFMSLYFGVVALWLAWLGRRGSQVWLGLAAGGLLLAMASGDLVVLLLEASGGLFRFPQKFLFWTALAAPLLAGWGLERALAARRWPRAPLALAAAALLGAAALAWARPGWMARAEAAARPHLPELVATQTAAQILALVLAAALLAAAAAAARHGRPALLLAAQLGGLLQLYPLAATTPTVPYLLPAAWQEGLPRGAGVHNELTSFPPWPPAADFAAARGSRADLERLSAEWLDSTPGVLHGLSYPLAPDLEGMSSPLHTLLIVNLPKFSWEHRARWFRLLGLEAVVLRRDPGLPGLVAVDRDERFGVAVELLRVRDPSSPAWWPETAQVVESPVAALRAVLAEPDPVAHVVTADAVAHTAGGRVTLRQGTSDRLALDVDGPGGVVVVRRAYHTLWRARAGERPLATFPVNLVLLGVAVPPGEQRVVVEVAAWPEVVAGGIALAALVAVVAAVALALPGGRWRRVEGGAAPG